MIRRPFALAAAAALLTVSATAAESRHSGQAPQFNLRALFEHAPGVDNPAGGSGVTEGLGATEIIVARVGPDGKLIKVCVNSEAAVRRFLDAPLEALETKQARQQ